MQIRQGDRLAVTALTAFLVAMAGCKAVQYGAQPTGLDTEASFEPSEADGKLLAVQDDCTPIRTAIATRKSDSNLVTVETGQRDGQAHAFITVYPNSRPGANGTYHCKAPIVLDRSHTTVRGGGNAIITMKMLPLSAAPMLVLGSIDPPVYDESSKGWDKIRKVNDVHFENFFLDGNRFQALSPKVHKMIAQNFTADPELAKVLRFASEIVAALSQRQPYKFPIMDQIDETVDPLKALVNDRAPATDPASQAVLTPRDFARFESNVFKARNLLRAAKTLISPQSETPVSPLTLLPPARLGQYIDLRDTTRRSEQKLFTYIGEAAARLDKFISFYRNTVNVYECWLLDKEPEVGKLICDNAAHPTSHVRNNGVTIRGVRGGSVRNVTAINTLSGGMVTEKNCERLFVDNFEATENYYDGFAGYKTVKSTFCRMNLHENNNAAISIDQHFSHNVFDKSRFFQNGDVGIFARESQDNLFRNVTIVGNRNHGVFLSEVDANGPTTGAANYKFESSCLAYSEGFGIRVNDAGSSGVELRNVVLHNNLLKGLSLSESARIKVNETRSDFDTALCKTDEENFKKDYTSCEPHNFD